MNSPGQYQTTLVIQQQGLFSVTYNGFLMLMSDMFIVTKQLVKGCQTLLMDPTGLLQQSLGNTVPHIMMEH